MRVRPRDAAAGRPITRCSVRAERGRRVRGHRHRHRHRAGEAEADLRGVPAGRRRHQPQVRRHRPRPRDQPRAGDAARRRDPAGQRARAGQHVHALPAARLHRARRAVTRAGDRARAAPTAPRRCRCSRSPRPRRSSPTIATTSREGDRVLLIVEDDPHYARILLGLARDKGFKGIVANRGQTALSLARAVPADRDHPRHLPARHARLDGAEQPQARSGARATSRCRCCRSRRSASTACRTARSPTWSSRRRPRTSRRAFDRIKTYVAPHTQAAAGRRGQRHRARRASSSCSRTTTSRSTAVGTGGEALDALRERRVRLLRPRPAAARHERLRAARAAAGGAERCATCRSSSSPARS